MQNNILLAQKWGIVSLGFILSTLYACSSPGLLQDQPQVSPHQTSLLSLPMNKISLENMEAFEPAGANWTIAGNVHSDRRTEKDLRGLDGTGILVNNPAGQDEDHLFTKFVHGDLELELDFLMPKGSNSGIYLMGRYEVQLLDSWGIGTPGFGDCGGIYQRWDENRPEGQKGYEGHPPTMNASRAPGLWQHLKVLFKAPEFNAEGEKITNAQFEEVWLNGVLVQENVEVTGPTQAAAFDDEKPLGPLMIQGDHGPVAIRNIYYKKYDKDEIALTGLEYEYYPGAYDTIPDFDTLNAAETGTVDSLSGSIGEGDDRYALRYTGQLHTPNAGTYLFKVNNAGMMRLIIDGEVLIDQDRFYRFRELTSVPEFTSETVILDSGAHSFILEYIDHPKEWLSGLALFGEGPRFRLQKFHASSSVPGGGRETPPLVVQTENRIRTIRSFAMHRGGKRTHVINVGSPSGIHYNYDMGQAALLHVWNGPFINTNEMWVNRGESQLAEPLGSVLALDGLPSLARLNSNEDVWPDSGTWDQLHIKGYEISDEGWPVFKYTFGEVEVTDQLEVISGSRKIIRSVSLDAPRSQKNLWFHLATGKDIFRKDDGEYVVDDRTYYLNIVENGGIQPVLRQTAGRQELLIPVLRNDSQTVLTYVIIW